MSPSSSPTLPPADFASRLRASRLEKDLTQLELAQKAGLQPSAVSHFETGRRTPSLENLIVLADALNLTADYLLGREQRLRVPERAACRRRLRR